MTINDSVIIITILISANKEIDHFLLLGCIFFKDAGIILYSIKKLFILKP